MSHFISINYYNGFKQKILQKIRIDLDRIIMYDGDQFIPDDGENNYIIRIYDTTSTYKTLYLSSLKERDLILSRLDDIFKSIDVVDFKKE